MTARGDNRAVTPTTSSTAPAAPAAAVKLLTVDDGSDGQRLDNFLMRELKGVPKTHIYRIIRSGEVRVNKGRVQADTRLKTGEIVRLPPLRTSQAAADKIMLAAQVPPRQFTILHEDERLIAINKPQGVAVHGGSGVSFGVIEQLRSARPEAKFLELVHRLDRDTSGILLIAKKRSSLNAVQAQFRDRSVQKTYLAWVWGAWPAKLKVIDKALHKYLAANGERRVRLATPSDGDDDEAAEHGKRAISIVKVVASVPCSQLGLDWVAAVGSDTSASLLEVTIKTGRTHQIRVHLASSGHPIIGDDKYGDFARNKALAKFGVTRMHLHAWRLSLNATDTTELLDLVAPNPFGLKIS